MSSSFMGGGRSNAMTTGLGMQLISQLFGGGGGSGGGSQDPTKKFSPTGHGGGLFGGLGIGPAAANGNGTTGGAPNIISPANGDGTTGGAPNIVGPAPTDFDNMAKRLRARRLGQQSDPNSQFLLG